jgi:hypothetical protein
LVVVTVAERVVVVELEAADAVDAVEPVVEVLDCDWHRLGST